MKKLMMVVLGALCIVPCAMAENVSYLNYDAASGTFTNATAECTVVTSATTAFADGGWYVAKGTNTCAGTITVSGSAHLILADEAELTAGKGICVSIGNSFAIYGQGEGTGKLIAKARGTGSAAVGGAAPNRDCGAITVNGGVVEVVANVTGGSFVGIGGAMGGGHGGVVTINGGLVTVDGPIGGDKGVSGGNGGDGGTLMVNGGRLTASKICGGAGGSGIGREPGSDGAGVKATFLGGVTEALNGIFTDGDPIVADGMKVTGDFNVASYISVGEQEGANTRDVVFVLGGDIIGITTDFTGESLSEGNRVTLKDAEVGAKIGIIEVICAPGFEYRGATEFVVSAVEMPHELNATLLPVEYAIPGESALSIVRNVSRVIPGPNTFTNGGWYVATARQSCGVIEVKGMANLILADGAELTVDGGIRVTEGNSLTIYGQGEGTGKLIATGAEGCAGIGGGCGNRGVAGYWRGEKGSDGGSGESCGAVTINGGVVAAIGGTGAAGIGGGAGGAGGNAGNIKKTGDSSEPPERTGAWGGAGGSGGVLTINGGIITASGGTGAAGLGGGIGGIGGTGFHADNGPSGKNGAGATVTFLGGVTEAQNGIFTKGDPILGANIEVTGRFNETAYIRIAEKTTPTLSRDQVAQAEWSAETTVTVVSTALKSGDTTLDKAEYENACLFYGIEAKQEPTAEDYKAVSKDAQVVQEGEIAVKEAELQAAKAETVTVADGVVTLAVGVNSNADFTAETKDWKPVELKQENVKVENGKIVITIPVSDKSGFMILQSGDAKVGTGKAD